MRKRVFEHMRPAKAHISLRISVVSSGPLLPLTESLDTDTTEWKNGEQRPG